MAYTKLVNNTKFNLLKMRKRLQLTQAEMADKIGVSRSQYGMVEQGRRQGTHEFWKKLQCAFDVPDNEMWQLMNG